MADSPLFSVVVDDQEFEVERVGDDLRVAPRGSEDLAETVDLAHLPDGARTALDNGSYDDVALQQAAEGIARAIAARGA